ncbi:acyltransferase family protein [Paenibacillus turpanensis]|uniref:acyltransferase family protein n=1 Tax=Paenibacillus turpanensis TaxID=2689078 RepID=UPI00140B4C51|nr:acyltransferase family protein [Paenibacillus turpanensis]
MEKPNRLIYLDRIKVLMTALVVLHHTAIMYGGSGSWYYYENQNFGASAILLTLFTVTNQSFFMGLFFFISGYVTPASFDRKGELRFMKDRILRFGVPMLFYMMIITPLLQYVSLGAKESFGDYMWGDFLRQAGLGLSGFEIGPLWFLFALLLFNGAYAAYRRVDRVAGQDHSALGAPKLTARKLLVYLALVGLGNFVIRLWMPIGEELLSLQLGYFPAYIGLFAGGIAAYRGQWLHKLTVPSARRWGTAAILAFIALPVAMIFGGALEGDTSAFEGGMTWQSAFYSIVDPILGLGISMVLLVWYRKRKDIGEKRTAWWSTHAFGAYIFHPLAVTYIAFALQGLEIFPLLKFILVGGIAVPISFAAASLVRKIPRAARIL